MVVKYTTKTPDGRFLVAKHAIKQRLNIMNRVDNQYTINENERKKILDDINVGIWRIELVPDQQPRMFGDVNMHAILGAEPQMQPEELYQYWHERIEPAYLLYVDKAVERLLTMGQPAEVEYIWNHPQCGKTVVRCDATLSSPQESGKTVMLGMHRDITDKLVNTIWQEDGYHIFDYYKMSHCGKHLIRAYEDIFLVDIETKAIHMIAYKKDHCSTVKDGGSILDVIDQCVPSEDRERLYNIFSDEAMQKIAAKKETVSVDFRRGVQCGRYMWVRGTLHTIQINGINELLFVLQDIQNEYKLKKMKEEKEDVLLSVIHARSVIYEYNTKLQRIKLLKHDSENIAHSVSSSKMTLPELVEKLCAHYVDRSERAKVMGFLSDKNISKCVQEKCKESISCQLDAAYFQHNYTKISILPSSQLKTKAYLVMELTDRKERLYPILESYMKDTVDYFYCIDLKMDYFFRFIGDTEVYDMPPQEGYNYTKEVSDYVDRFVLEEDRELIKKQMSPEYILKTLEDQQEFSFVERVIGEHGEKREKLLIYRSLDLAKGYVLLQRTDITDLYNKERMLEKAQRESMTDTLTQLYNRLGSERLIKKALTETDEKKNAVLIMMDLDNFKEINDKFGHPTGDRVLSETAQKLKECFRSEDIIGRIGGDEYIVFLPSMFQKSDIHTVLKRVVQKLNIVYKNETESVTVTASIGAAFCNGQPYEELYKEADIALYHSKKKKNRYSLYDEILYERE